MKRFAANTVWLILQYVFQYILSAVIGIIAARYMGPSNYGILSYGATMIAMFTPFCTLGIENALIPCMVDAPDRAGDLIGTALVMRLVSTTLSIGAMLALTLLLKPGQTLILIATALQALQLLVQVLDVFRLWFQLKLLNKFTAIGSVIGNIVCSAWRIILLIRGASVEWFALTSAIQMFANYLFVVPMFFGMAKLRLSVSAHAFRCLWDKGKQLILAGLTNVIATRIGALILSQMLGDAPLAFYTAAHNVAMMWVFVPQALIDSATPMLMEVNRDHPEDFWKSYQLLEMSVLIICVLAGVGITALSPFIIRVLYGEAYAGAADALRVLAWLGIFTSIGTGRNIWTMAKEKQKYVKYYCLVSAVVSIGSNILLIRLWGYMGAAAAILIVNVVQALLAPMLFRETREFTRYYLDGIRRLPSAARQLPGMLKRLKRR